MSTEREITLGDYTSCFSRVKAHIRQNPRSSWEVQYAFAKAVELVTDDDLDVLILNGVREGRTLEHKVEEPNGIVSDRRSSCGT